MKTLLASAAALELATGLALVIGPATVARLLLGEDLSGVGLPLGRVAGFALFSLGIACWPEPDATRGAAPALGAMLIYNGLASTYLFYLGARAGLIGPLLWPAAAIHAGLTVFLGRSWFQERQTDKPKVGNEKEPSSNTNQE